MAIKSPLTIAGQDATAAPHAQDAVQSSTVSRIAGIPVFLLLLAGALVAMVVTIGVASQRPLGEPSTVLVRWWLLSLLLLGASIAWDPLVALTTRIEARTLTWSWSEAWRRALPWIAMTLLAAIPRLLMLDRWPTVLDGDEAAFMRMALQSANGDHLDPFGADFYTVANLYSWVMGRLVPVTGGDPASLRTLGAVIGTAGVIACWRLGRHLAGPEAGALAGILLATMPFHLFLSRVSINNVVDPTFLALAMLCLLRYVATPRMRDAVLCGASLGVAFYGYFGGRVFPVVVIAIVIVFVVTRQLAVRDAITLVGYAAIGFLVTTAPMLVTFWMHPELFSGDRSTHQWIVSGELLREQPMDTLEAYARNLWKVLIFPVHGDHEGHYHHPAPFLGWPMAILLVIGLAVTTVQLARRSQLGRLAVLIAPWLAMAAGIAVIIPIFAQRFAVLTPIWAILAGSGLWFLARLTRYMVTGRGWLLAQALAAMLVIAISGANLLWWTSEDRQIENLGTTGSIGAWDLAWRLEHGEGEPAWSSPVIFAGAPWVFVRTFPFTAIMTGNRTMTDHIDPLTTAADVPEIPAGTLFVLSYQRASERCSVIQRYPDATMAEAHARNGALLYVVLWRGRVTGFSLATTPAGSTIVPVTEHGCAFRG
jgi:4-amino-4-deoxy-L-arabinose transferase-like glycosyltransferase